MTGPQSLAEAPAALHAVEDFERQPKNDIKAEQCVLGGIMISPAALDDVTDLIKAADFYRPAHQLIYQVILDLYGKGEPYDAVSVNAELARRGELGRMGGAPYLHTCISGVPTAANAGYYAKIVRKCARMRDLVVAGTYLAQMGMDGDPDLYEDYLERAHEKLVESEQGTEDVPLFVEALMTVLDKLENGGGTEDNIPAPYEDLESLLGGFRPGQLITIAARPGVGKSVLAVDIARHATIKWGLPVFMSSVEMTREEIVQRALSAETGVELHKIRSGDPLVEADWSRVDRHLSRVTGAPFIIDENPHVTLHTIRASLRRMQRRTDVPPAKMLIVDYLQLLTSVRKVENRNVEVSEMSRGLKLIAKEFKIPVIMLSQLNRSPEQRADKKPVVSDLRDSGSIEQDSDVVILIHREDVYEKEHPRAGEADLIVGKNRNGPTTTVTVAFQGHRSRFADMARMS